MYRAEDLCAYPFFEEILKTDKLPFVLDSLTGLISRPYILRFIQHQIAQGTPFGLAIIDLDNFKSINDNYGHILGDAALSRIAEDLRTFIGDQGLVGRFGGDEFLMIFFGTTAYDDIYALFKRMYTETVFRRTMRIGQVSLYVTATSGCAVYPADAQDYDTLFTMADKTLYRGKTKGRNCYIIYVKEKHQNIEIAALAHHSLYDILHQMADGFKAGETLHEKMLQAFLPMHRHLFMHKLLYINLKNELIDVEADKSLGTITDLEQLPVLPDLASNEGAEKLQAAIEELQNRGQQTELTEVTETETAEAATAEE